MANDLTQEIARAWDLPWHEMEVLIGGKSSVDLPRMRVKTWQDAGAFLLNYGFDPDHPDQQRMMHAVFVEGLNFIERFLWNPDAQQVADNLLAGGVTAAAATNTAGFAPPELI